jgi:hypothetical protein
VLQRLAAVSAAMMIVPRRPEATEPPVILRTDEAPCWPV